MRRNFPQLFFLILLLAVTVTFFALIQSYLLSVFWAIVLAILFHGVFDHLIERSRLGRNVSALLTLLVILVVVIVPSFLIGSAVITEALSLYQQMESGEYNIRERLDNLRDQVPAVEGFLRSRNIDTDELRRMINESVSGLSSKIFGVVINITQNTVSLLIHFLLMLYTLFFFIRDGRKLLELIVWALPIGDEHEWALLRRFESVTKATVKGSLVVAIVQGSMGGILFWAVGIPGAILWGVVMIIASILPLGSGVIWGPAALILYIQGDVSKALIIVLIGSLVIGVIDNFLRPRLVGSDTKLPDYLVLITTLGGLNWFGISGFVLGPMIGAFFVTCWEMLGHGVIEDPDQPATGS